MSFICDFNCELKNKESMILQSIDSLLHFKKYDRKILLSDRFYFLGSTAYEEYPITSFENDKFIIFLEGQIYNKDNNLLKVELINLAELIFQSHNKKNDQIIRWLLNTDGDFIVFVLNKKYHTISIFNDALGHLPLYYYKTEKELVISRELRFITTLLNENKFNRMALAQNLLLGYSLGKRTFLENIYRLEPATIVNILLNESQINIKNIYKFNFEEKDNKERNIKDNINQLVSIFSEACKSRATIRNGFKNILSLSGGLDSRTVGSCLHYNNIPFYSATKLIGYEKETETAKQIANIFNSEWTLFRLDPPKGKDYLKLLKIKNGLNYLTMSSQLSYLEKINETYGTKVNLFTGDGGDRVIAFLKPYKTLKNIDELFNSIISTFKIIPLDDVVAITEVQKNELIDDIKNHLLSYPEKDFNQKYVHYNIDWDIAWGTEGIDRNRFYVWPATPLWSIQFFKYAMNCLDEQKKYYKLYRKFLHKLSPKAANIKYANYNTSLISMEFKAKLFLTYKMPRELKEIIKKVTVKNRNSYDLDSNIVNCLREQISSCKSISNYFSYPSIDGFLKKCDKRQFNTLFTLTSIIEELECNKSTIKKYYESEFI